MPKIGRIRLCTAPRLRPNAARCTYVPRSRPQLNLERLPCVHVTNFGLNRARMPKIGRMIIPRPGCAQTPPGARMSLWPQLNLERLPCCCAYVTIFGLNRAECNHLKLPRAGPCAHPNAARCMYVRSHAQLDKATTVSQPFYFVTGRVPRSARRSDSAGRPIIRPLSKHEHSILGAPSLGPARAPFTTYTSAARAANGGGVIGSYMRAAAPGGPRNAPDPAGPMHRIHWPVNAYSSVLYIHEMSTSSHARTL